jgi:hypothetical protein
VIHGNARADGNGSTDQFERLFVLALLLADDAQKVQRVRVVRFRVKDLSIRPLSLVESALLMKPDCRVKQS